MTPATLFPSEPETVAYPGEPAIWLQRVVILPARRTGVEPIRNIELRRGLNVINTKLTQDVETAAFGHNVGKTLLVRMIRYALGDEHYAGTRVRSRIKEKFPEACVLAQVRVNGTTWGIARSLARPRDSFSLPTENWQDLLADASVLRPFSEFQTALENLVPSAFTSVRVARGRREPTWTDLLGWLIRDQHCRYTSHNTWRFREDEADPDVILDTEANLIIRVVMNLFDRKEYDYTDELHRLGAQLRQHQAELQQIRQDRERTAKMISEDAGITEDLTEGDLAQAAIRGKIEEQRQKHESDLERLPEAKALDDADRDLVARRSERDKIEGRIDQLRRDLTLTNERLALAQRPDEKEALAQMPTSSAARTSPIADGLRQPRFPTIPTDKIASRNIRRISGGSTMRSPQQLPSPIRRLPPFERLSRHFDQHGRAWTGPLRGLDRISLDATCYFGTLTPLCVQCPEGTKSNLNDRPRKTASRTWSNNEKPERTAERSK